MNLQRLACLTAAMAVLGLATVGGAGMAQTPPAPPIPTPPTPTLPHIPDEKSEKFKVVLEGKTHAERVIDIGGNAGPCAVTLHEDIQENTTFGRGKGWRWSSCASSRTAGRATSCSA